MPTRDEAWPQGTPCWIDCQVDDTTAARAFYSELFGWDIPDDPVDPSGYLIARLHGRPAAAVGPKPVGLHMPSVWTTYFAVDSADEIAARITAAGGQVIVAPFDVADAGRMAVAADLTGGVFGLWQTAAHHGAAVFDEPGSYCWNELHTPGFQQARAFYSEVFGWHYTDIADTPEFTYATFALPGRSREVGGMMDAAALGAPPAWLAWIQVEDTDGVLATATELGATVLTGPGDSPFGRGAVVQGPQGEVFGVIDPAKAVGEVPTGI
ncbi:VOC family protein [Nocardia sp. NPDC058176]|uniref:VOC family protein n=1 Tax=Nocardia sp. NPDC058176 TaxID=3346368 RepID=UPI0036DD5C0A